MAPASGKRVWAGRVISVLASLVFLMSASMKLIGGPELAQGMAHLQLPDRITVPLTVLEVSCTVIYLIPATSVLGAVLLTGYLGGAILTHWRVGDPVYIHIVLGLLVWLGLYLRESRLKALLPVRRPWLRSAATAMVPADGDRTMRFMIIRKADKDTEGRLARTR